MWRCTLYTVAILAILFTTFGCGGGFSKILAGINEEFVLCVGQRVSISGEDLEVKFKDVIGDSRCPSNVTCVWAGQVICMVELKHGGSSSQMALTDSGLTSEYSKETYERYRLAFQVTPYPVAGQKIAKDEYRLHLIVVKPQPTEKLGSVLAEPMSFVGQNITVVGYYRGWDLLHEANVTPPVSRSDWVIRDKTGAIYISANSEAVVPDGLDPGSLDETDVILEVTGVVRVTETGQPYIEATSIVRLF